MNSEALARQQINAMLEAAGWIVQSRDAVNLYAGEGVAVREVPTPTGPADYVLFLDRRACAVLEAKPEGVTLLGVASQGADYAAAAPTGYPHWSDPLPFLYLSTGTETLFCDSAEGIGSPSGERPGDAGVGSRDRRRTRGRCLPPPPNRRTARSMMAGV